MWELGHMVAWGEARARPQAVFVSTAGQGIPVDFSREGAT